MVNQFRWKRPELLQESEQFIWKNNEFVWKHERIYMEQIWKSEEFVQKCEGFIKTYIYVIYIYGKMMNLTEQVKEIVWQKYGKVKNLYGNVKDL